MSFLFYKYFLIIFSLCSLGSSLAMAEKKKERFEWSELPLKIKHQIWDYVGYKIPEQLAEVHQFQQGKSVSGVAFSPDSSLVVSVGADNILRVWNLKTGNQEHEFKQSDEPGFWGRSVGFSPDGTNVVFGGRNDIVRIWNLETENQEQEFKHGDWVNSVAFTDNNKVVSCGCLTVQVWNLETGTQEQKFDHGGNLLSSAFSPDGTKVVFGRNGCDRQNNVQVWNLETEKLEQKFYHVRSVAFGSDHVKSVAFSPDNKRVVSGGGLFVRIWDLETGKQKQEFKHGNKYDDWVKSVDFNHDGKKVVSYSSDETVRIWNLETGTQEQEFKLADSQGGAAFSPDGRNVVAGDGEIVRIWKLGLPATFKRKKQDGSIEASVLDPLKVQLLMQRLAHAIKKKEADVLDKLYQQENEYYAFLNQEFDGSIASKLLALKNAPKLLALKKQKNKKKMKTKKK